MTAGKKLWAKRVLKGLKQIVRFEHAPITGFAAGLIASIWSKKNRTVLFEDGSISLSRGMRPHLLIHRRCDKQQTAVPRARKAKCREEIVTNAVC